MVGVAGSEQAPVLGGLAIAVVLSLTAFFDTATPLAYPCSGSSLLRSIRWASSGTRCCVPATVSRR